MVRRVLSITALVAVLALGVALVAQAQEPRPALAGSLAATGDGYVQLGGRGAVAIQGHGSGVIHVGQGTVEASGSGERFALPKGGTLLVAWNGEVKVTGDRIGLRLIGHQVELTATGAGQALLVGTGSWQKGDGETGTWSATGTKVAYGVAGAITGQGPLTAQGAGDAAVRIKGRVEIQGHGQNVIRIKGATTLKIEDDGPAPAADAKAKAGRQDLADGTVVLRNLTGKVTAEGEQLVIGMRSPQVDLKAAGTGGAGLKGTGTWSLTGKHGEWTAAGLRFKITP